jgi:protein-S-isoprenylcysteine O-methyltransferase Ste14
MSIIDMRPPRIALALTLIAAVLHWTLNIWQGLSFSWLRGGAILVLAGFSLMMWSWGLFKKRNIAICPKSETASLITDGPYRFTRNPMYLGFVLILAGLALGVGTPPFYLSAIVYFMIINFVFCPYEESKLINSFGCEYILYMRQVRRWI